MTYTAIAPASGTVHVPRLQKTSGSCAPAWVLGVFLTLLLPSIALAQPHTVGDDATVGVQGGRFGVGAASSWPAYGISGTLQLSETLTAEAIIGFLGTVSNFSARGWYRFNRNTTYDFYGYGTVGVLRYRYDTIDQSLNLKRDTESVLGVGGGVGIEAGLNNLLKDENFPPIFVNAEVGVSFADFKYYSGFSTFIFGLGVHYRFGQ